MRISKFLISTAIASFAVLSQAQFSQPWTGSEKGFTSRIPNCTSPFGPPGFAADDFISASTSTLTVLVYWCNVSTPAQLNKPVHISVYPNTPGACFPDFTVTVYTACFVPAVKTLVGTDCLGRKVWRCAVLLPSGGINVIPGVDYWLQLSEDDASSMNPGVDDWKWCGHFGNVNCPAFQLDPSGIMRSPLPGCGAINDLAFRLF